MKLSNLSMMVAGLVAALPAVGQDEHEEADPFDTDYLVRKPGRPPTPEERFGDLIKMIQVQLEWIEMDLSTASRLMFLRDPKGDSTPLRKEVQELIVKKEAELVETAIAIALPGQKAVTESVREYIYPTEYEPPELPNEVEVKGKQDAKALAQLRTPATPTAFETRRLGTTLEIEPNLGSSEKVIDLRFAPQIIKHTGESKWQTVKDGFGQENSIRMPLFYSMRMSTGIVCQDGEYRFIGLLTPPGKDGEVNRSRKLMVFVRCDVVAIGEEDLAAELAKEKEEAAKKEPKKEDKK